MHLVLDHNQINLLNVEVFIKLPRLHVVLINYNYINTIQNDLQDISSVINVERLSYNRD